MLEKSVVSFKPRIGLLALYWEMFDPIMPAHFREEKEILAQQAARILSQRGEVIFPGLIINEAQGAAAGRAFESNNVDIVVVFPCMASPPSFGWNAVATLKDVPVVFWNAHLADTIPEDFDASGIVRHSSNVGAVMLTNVLLREGRTFKIFTGQWDDNVLTERMLRAVQSAGAATRLRRARLGVLGDVIPGYLDVIVDGHALKRDLGIELVPISAQELTQAFRNVTPDQENQALREMHNWIVEGVGGTDQTQSARLAVALEHLVEEHHLDCGAVNCHTQYFRENPAIGIVACYAVSRLLAQGVPFTCTGDIPTAVAALMVKLLGGAAQCCECDMIDYRQNYILLSNTGEGDPSIAAGFEHIRVVSNEQFKKGTGSGTNLVFPFQTGPGTMVGFSPRKSARRGWSLVIAEGTIIDKHFPQISAPNAGFRFKNGSAADAFNRWCLGGATHHGIITSGDYVEALVDLAEFLGIEAWLV